MKKLIFSIFLFGFITLLLNILLQFILDRFNKKIPSGWNNCYQPNLNADVLILGSSRAVKHIAPKIIDTILNVHSYNLGKDGIGFLIQNCRFKTYLRNNKRPRYIIHSLDERTLCKVSVLFNSKEYIPYLEDTLVRKSTSGCNGSFNKWHYSIPLFKYNNALPSLIRPLLWMTGFKEQNKRYKGYLPEQQTWQPKVLTKKSLRKIDTEITKEFEAYLMFCKKENINLILVYTPEYIEGQKVTTNRNELFNLYRQYATTYNLPFFDYSNDSLSYDKSLFYDFIHLNKKGSELFTTKLAHDLKQQLK
jgi:hypothetical protein